MLLSLSWLREFTPYEGTAQALGDRLTMLGLELEAIHKPFAALDAILVGYVAECIPHPDSDHMHCCKVDVGQGELLDIVCGAPNVAQGQKVAVATVGTTLPDGLTIKKAKLRGQPSFGMICSEREMGLSDDHSGILVLPESTQVGARITDVLKLDTEILDLSITPNRADCLSVLGLARETAMAFNLPLAIPPVALVEGDAPAHEVPIEIRDADLCWLYAGRVISDLKVAPSPMHIRHRLKAVGVRPISNIVDVTNYILFECGQPLHSFDLDRLAGGRIVVKAAAEGERFVTLDGVERTLTTRDLTICDAEKPIALAGVMGGLNSEITDATRNVFLESAVFRPGTIRKTSRRLGLSSEASYRFERGIDQQRSVFALERACAMIAALGGGVVNKCTNVAEPRPFAPVNIPFSPAKAESLLGIQLGKDFCGNVLGGMGCEMDTTKEPWTIKQPSWRPDLTREADLIEEVGRVYGLDNIPPELPALRHSLDDAGRPKSQFAFWLDLRHWGRGLGLNEVINYSFVGHADLDLLDLPRENRISIMNPLSSEQDALRTTLAPGLLNCVRNNLAQGAQGIRLFELANVFTKDEGSETSAHERGQLGIVLHGSRHDTVWPQIVGDFDYVDIKGIVEHVLHFLHLANPECRTLEQHPYLAPAVDVRLNGDSIGVMGRVKPDIADKYLAKKPVWMAELDLDLLRSLHDATSVRFVPLAVFPAVRRDITVTVGTDVHIASIVEFVSGMQLPLLENISLVDIFTPEGEDTRNLTFRLTFRHGKRTLKDAEVDKEREKVAQALVKNLGVRV